MRVYDTSTAEPDLEFDGLITSAGDATAPCEVLIWLPRRPEDDAKVEITLRRDAHSVDLRGLVRIRSAEHVERRGLRFEADDIFVRGGTSNFLRSSTARLTLTHINRFRIEYFEVKDKHANAQQTQDDANSVGLAYFQMVLSSLSYGGQHAIPTVHYLGHRNLKFEDVPKSLCFRSPVEVHAFELQRHWAWRSLDKGRAPC